MVRMATAVNATAEHVEVPEFAAAMRGYDRLQVDEYIARIDRWWQEARVRMEAAEARVRAVEDGKRELPRRVADAQQYVRAEGEDGAGERISALLQDAFDECDGLRRRAAEEA